MSRAKDGGEGTLKRCVSAGVTGVMDEGQAAAAGFTELGSGRCTRALCHFGRYCLDGKTSPDIHYQANTNRSYLSVPYISRIVGVFSHSLVVFPS